MKKIILLLLALVMGLSVTAVATGCDPVTDYTVGIVQFVKHDALDAATNGFKEELKRLLEEQGKTVHFIVKDGGEKVSECTTIVNNFVARKVDLIMANATPAAAVAKEGTEDSKIPVLFTSVTDPVSAELVNSIEEPGGNVSGTSDKNPVNLQVELIRELVPGITKVAILYNTSEQNSIVQKEWLIEECQKYGITVLDAGIPDNNSIQAKMQQISADTSVGAIYIPTDNMLAKAAAQVHNVNKALSRPLPIVCGEIGMNEKCGIATYGLSYYKLGKLTGKMAFEILFEGKDISKMGIRYSSVDDLDYSVNTKVAQEINFTIPQAILDRLED